MATRSRVTSMVGGPTSAVTVTARSAVAVPSGALAVIPPLDTLAAYVARPGGGPGPPAAARSRPWA